MIKRVFDIVIAVLGVIIMAPLYLLLILLVYRKQGPPVFFKQVRPGLNRKPFRIYKFQTMTEERDEDGNLLSDAERITSLGDFLRSSSLDELPELWNVIKGDMSLVGPRPLLMEYLPLYSSDQMRRHEVRPGITGWTQIHGRNTISWDEKFKLDVWYIENQSFMLDLKVLALTIKRVIDRDGIHAIGDATMPKFEGPGNIDE